jgi:probable F420-dependent oxidoreductase
VDLGPVGVWTFQLDRQPAARAGEIAAELEELGYGAVWLPEAVGRDPLVGAALLLGATDRITVATGIASIYARDAMAMAAGWKTVSEAHPGRFVLGLGVSHAPMVEGMRGHAYGPPLTTMRAYLDAMDAAMYVAAEPPEPTRRVLAALGPKMLALAAERADGAHPYFVTPEHTARAREVLGREPVLATEQAAVLETDPAEARRVAREHMAIYLGLPNYVNNLKRLGFTDDDIAAGGSDRLADAIVAWGDVNAVRARVRAHHDAGADHVCVQVLAHDFGGLPLREWRELAPALVA